MNLKSVHREYDGKIRIQYLRNVGDVLGFFRILILPSFTNFFTIFQNKSEILKIIFWKVCAICFRNLGLPEEPCQKSGLNAIKKKNIR